MGWRLKWRPPVSVIPGVIVTYGISIRSSAPNVTPANLNADHAGSELILNTYA